MMHIGKHLKSIGYHCGLNIVDYWFNNESECIRVLDAIRPGFGQRVATQIRWKTKLGLILSDEVRAFINNQQNTKQVSSGRAVIDFNLLSININGVVKNINDWLYTISSSSTYSGWNDLRGIDLSKIEIRSSEIKNACFANAIFKCSKFNMIIICNCNFSECDFANSFIAGVQTENIPINNSNLSGATLNALSLGQDSVGTRPQITEISYLNLLVTALASRKVNVCGGHTDFSRINLLPSVYGEEQKYLSYISWYQDTILKYTGDKTYKEKIMNILSAAITKNWHSFLAAFLASAILIIAFANAYYYIGGSGFNKQFPSLISAIYYSVVTFTTLGYGDIYPNLDNNYALALVIVEVILGYIMLGVFLFILTNRINERKP